jgi:DNA-binding Lrp family transcriptional regulator
VDAAELDAARRAVRAFIRRTHENRERIAAVRAERNAYFYAAIDRYWPVRDAAPPPARRRAPSAVERAAVEMYRDILIGSQLVEPMTYAELEAYMKLSERPVRRLVERLQQEGLVTVDRNLNMANQAAAIVLTAEARDIAGRLLAAVEAEEQEPVVERQTAYGWRVTSIAASGMSAAWWQRKLEARDRAGTGAQYPPRSEWGLPAVPELPTEAAYWAKVRELNGTVNALAADVGKAVSAELDAALAPLFAATKSDTEISEAVFLAERDVTKRRWAWELEKVMRAAREKRDAKAS